MLKKRIIFTLLYDNGHFVLSRNFRLQKVGTIDWLQKNYNFAHIAFYIDELVVLDVSRSQRDVNRFSETLKALTKGCFAPIAAGGGVRDLEHARTLLRSGADKVVVNSALFDDQRLVANLAQEFGQQCVVGSIDLKRNSDGVFGLYTKNGSEMKCESVSDLLEKIPSDCVGELYLNSINQDGTGRGFDLSVLNLCPAGLNLPIILAGGAGHGLHLLKGLCDKRVDAVATAHLFNFVGDGLKKARALVTEQEIQLAKWPPPNQVEENLRLTDGVKN
ncbi:cyclase [Ectothiorhodosinus mongolicus]|uniref:Cyclase n=1 Tax=Ectothiorhodosinus mongolicus TaxID=233100 RepID=A0A1R3VU05_9GAMM|nr:HisA/HisF-related TIM barrel protein [Ectothiorhodosinus mongolicus]ULX56801.1 imidazole glycerol phosphate synthase subunit HisF [Ectothiorhodosinus mongolicus]SIT68377.1 cyclase [Ectothiorhodosinus mongolicus]